MFSELPVLQGRTGYNVELNSAKTYAADAVSTVLLFNLKGARRTGAVHYNGRAMAESAKRKQRGIYEDIASKKSEKVIINNDNDDRRRLFESCMRQRKAVCNPIIDWKDSDVWDYIESEKIPVNPLYQVWLLPRWVRRLPYGWKSRQERRVCPLSEISGSVYTSVRANAGRTEAARKDSKAKLGNRAGRVSLVDRGRRFTGAD